MTIFTVTNTSGYGAGSLRQAITDSNSSAGADTINFAAGLSGMTINHTVRSFISGDLTIDGDINGDNIADITISGGTNNALMYTSAAIDSDPVVNLLSLNIVDGFIAGNGGAISHLAGTMNIEDSTFSGNRGLASSGAIQVDSAILNIRDSLFTDNTASINRGGAIGVYGATGVANLTNTTVHDNMSERAGGGIYVNGGGTLNLFNSTVTGNHSAGDNGQSGGGIADINGTVNITNSIVAENTLGGAATANDFSGSVDNSTNSFFGTTVVLTNDIGGNSINGGGDPLLAGLTNNGGTTSTLQIETGSQLIGAGSNAGIPSGVTEDANGDARIQNGTVDIGATEFSPVPETPSLVVTTADDVVDAFDNETSLREAISLANGQAGADTITFASGVGEAFENDALIRLTEGQLVVTDAVTVDGSTAGGEVVITGDADNDDATVGMSDITDVASSGAALLDDNSRVFNINSFTADTILSDLTITGGRATGSGGGIYSLSGLTLDGTTVSGNSTTGSGANGGGVAVGDSIIVTNSTVSDNSTSGLSANGGGIRTSGSTTIINSTVSGNSSVYSGGGISSFGTTITNSTVSGNSAVGFGGGVYSIGVGTITNSTISGNSAAGSSANGGGIANFGNLALTNSIVLGNSSAINNAEIMVSGSLTNTASIIGAGGETVTDVFAQTAVGADGVTLAGVLANNGGVVDTIAIAAGGAAHNAGIDADLPADSQDLDGDLDVTEAIPFDARGVGFNRIENGQSDAGAFEVLSQFSPGDDTVTLNDTGEIVDAFGGDDSVTGGLGNDDISGNTGNDSLFGMAGDDVLNGGEGDDLLDGGSNTAVGDTADYSDAASGVRVFLTDTNGQNTLGSGRDTHIGLENLIGSAFDDSLYGDGGDNVLEGGDGADRLVAGDGNDTLRGGEGDDILKGRGGDDMLFGDGGSDILFADAGVDALDGGADNDFLFGGSSNDVLIGGTGDDRLRGNLNNDTMNGGDGADLLFGGGQNDMLFGDAGDDNLDGENGIDQIDGGSGDDVVRGGALSDTFIFKTGNEIDRIRDWEDGVDMIDLTSYGFASEAAALAQFVTQGSNVRFIDGADTLIIEGELLTNITDADIFI